MRKGEFDVQLNWVFVLMAGTVILTFFFAVIQKQKSFSERKISESLKIGFEGIFTGAQSASDTIFTMSVPDRGVEFECSQECDCRFLLGKSHNGFNDKMIFAAPRVKGPVIALWAVDFLFPFRATTFLMVTNPATEYIFVVDSPTHEIYRQIEEQWPENFSHVRKSPQELELFENVGYDHAVFVFFDEQQEQRLHPSFATSSATGILLEKSGPAYEVKFYKKYKGQRALKLEPGSVFAPTVETLIGAVFAGNKNIYRCNVQATMKRLGILYELYSSRAQELDKTSECDYLESINQFEGAAKAANELSRAGNPMHAQELSSALQKLSQENDFFLKRSCPLIY